jgi:RNA polymerase sigma-70 factor (ECF subfamily)
MADTVTDPDADLITAAIAGNREALEALLRRHYDRIHGLAWQLTGSRSAADDIAQDVCCTLVEKLAGFRREAKFSTWLCGVVLNACRDAKRRHRSFLGFAEKLAAITGLNRGQDGRDLHDLVWLQSTIARMKPVYRDTFILVAGQQLSHAEAAEILGVAEATISWRMHQARLLIAAARGED